MSEQSNRSEQGGADNRRLNGYDLFVAVRTQDRRSLISPSLDTPDFFTFTVPPQERPLPVENLAQGLIRNHHGLAVNTDFALYPPGPGSAAFLMYQRHILDYEKSAGHGVFGHKAIRDTYHTLRESIQNSPDDADAENMQRHTRIKAELFHQLLRLF